MSDSHYLHMSPDRHPCLLHVHGEEVLHILDVRDALLRSLRCSAGVSTRRWRMRSGRRRTCALGLTLGAQQS